jgi:alpha-glucosidase
MKALYLLSLGLLTMTYPACLIQGQTINSSSHFTGEIRITAPPSDLKLDPFYKKYLNANGFPVVSSWRVPDSALLQAYKIIVSITGMLPAGVVHKMRECGVRIGVMARYEGTTDIPEHRFLANDTSINWDLRARGLGGSVDDPLTTCAEENLLCYQIDKYHAEDILIHEFAHTIHLAGIIQVDTTINTRLQKAFDRAIAAGKFVRTYAATDIAEYWAEGVQDWFNVNAEVPMPDGKHNHVNTRVELKEYDPELYAILAEYFPETNECISCHDTH